MGIFDHEALLTALGQTILFLVGVYGLIVRNDQSNKGLKDEVKQMKDELKKLAEVITQQAVQTARIDNLRDQVTFLQKTVEDLRRGAGWITKRSAVDGEYPG